MSLSPEHMGMDPPMQKRKSSWCARHSNMEATAMSVDYTGQWILLAGRRHLALQSLDRAEDDEDGMQKFQRNSKYEVSTAKFAICSHSQEYCAIATSQLIEVVTWKSRDPLLMYSLRAHTRVVTDIDWHSKEPHLLASCSIDTFTHLWDLRDPRKPTMSFSAVCMSGATQVGLNRVSGYLLATAHDGDLRIWDRRKGSCPIQYITAHSARIHGINWSHRHESQLTTASQDGTVKYFDINNSRCLEKMIKVSSPVWRARYTPQGDGLLTVIVPHSGHDELSSLQLWSNNNQRAPVCTFLGHTDVVLDFAWRPKSTEDTSPDMQLITWSRDCTLRLWRIDEDLQKLINREDSQTEKVDSGTDDMILEECLPQTKKKGGKRGDIESPPSCSLQHEFSLLNTNIPHIDVEELDPVKRAAMAQVSANGHVIVLQVYFPTNYPNVLPQFTYLPGTSVDDTLSAQLMRVLRQTANQRVKKGKTCLEQCLRALVTALKKSTSGGDKSYLRLQSPRLEGALSGALHDACVPFPKTSGARFSSVGILVTFVQPLNTKRISLRHQTTTPRALSALSGGYLGNVMGSLPVLYAPRDGNSSAFYLQDRVRKTSRHRLGPQQKMFSSDVTVYDLSKHLHVSRELAEKYVINTDNLAEMCKINKMVAEEHGRSDLVQCWSLAEMIATPVVDVETDEDMFYSQNPFSRNLLESLILHFAKNRDVQTAAMLCCAFGRHCPPSEMSRSSSSGSKSISQSPSGSPYHTILPLDTTSSHVGHQEWHLVTQLKNLRSNSWSDSLDDCRAAGNHVNKSLLGDSQRHFHDILKSTYAEMLYRWDLLVQRAKVLKYLSTPPESPRGVDFVTECLVCNRNSTAVIPFCSNCHRPLLYCALCRLPVRGAANACLQCGHGGHTLHMMEWFSRYDVCAAGCGCRCLLETTFTNEYPKK
ncbi:GATOR complex protein Wdr59 isoform X2 [Lutzomyia longipalpis]|uniref:GATOR complex protein Wdr59 isoform X2 n=1 Tax=Lutzomyia longipalpis TaxID=7200 RepID=UPI002483B52F|nr:GATOR complex protein Wdr59 isoform X2 [Lutzomyia longipalpis]